MLLHEATFDDELIGDAEAKKHSTTSEAIGVGVAMGAKRILLTHFSQRYQKIPSIGSMASLKVQLEDTEEAHEAMEGMEGFEALANTGNQLPVETAQTPTGQLLESLEQGSAQIKEDANYSSNFPSGTKDPFATLNAMTKLSEPSTPSTNDLKIGVAFDYMRVKVGDIIHLEKFTPALRELYKEAEKEELDGKAKKAAGEAPIDINKGVATKDAGKSAANKEPQETEREPGERSKRQEKKMRKRLSKENLKAEAAATDTESVSKPLEADNREEAALLPAASISALEPSHDHEISSDTAPKPHEQPTNPSASEEQPSTSAPSPPKEQSLTGFQSEPSTIRGLTSSPAQRSHKDDGDGEETLVRNVQSEPLMQRIRKLG